jgi:hypothetical protein
MDTRILPDGGELIYDRRDIVEVGDRGIPQTVLYRHAGDEKQPAYEVKIEVWNGVPVCTEVKVLAKPEDRVPIRAKDIKLVAAELENSISCWLSELAFKPAYRRGGKRGWERGWPVSAADRRAANKSVEAARRQTRRKMTDDLLAKVAETYKASSPPKHEAIALAFDVKPRTAQRYIEKAREACLLPPTTRGKTE